MRRAWDFSKRARRCLPPGLGPLRVQVLARLSVARGHNEPSEQSRARCDEALTLARMLADPESLAVALEARVHH